MSFNGDPYTNARAGVPVSSATVQTGVGLGRETVQRLDRLRACYGRSRSYVTDLALISGGLDGLERANATDVARFNDLAADAGMTWSAYVEAYVTEYGTKTYPPTVTQLEEKQWLRTSPAKRLPKAARGVAEEPFPRMTDVTWAAVTRMNAMEEEPATGGIVTAAPVVGEDRPPRGLRDVLG